MARRPSPRALGCAAFVVVLVLGGLVGWRPWLTAERPQITATPGLAGLFSRVTVPVRAGATACVAPVAFDPASRRAQLLVLARRRSGPAPDLLVVATAAGYRAAARVAGYARGADASVSAPITPPARALEGRLCVTPAGGRIELVGTNEPRSLTDAQVTVDGRPVGGIGVAVTLTTGARSTFAGHLGTVADRASALTGGLVASWLAWLLLVVGTLALPLGTLAALALALRDAPAASSTGPLG